MKLSNNARITLLVALFSLAVIPLFVHQTTASEDATLHGKIMDESTGEPIVNATVQLWDTTYATLLKWRLTDEVKTDQEGEYSISITNPFQCRVYSFYDDPNSPGFDYVPAYKEFYNAENRNVTLYLKPGGSINVEGDVRFVESYKPVTEFTFLVINPETGKESDEGRVSQYGHESLTHNFLELDSRHVIIPAETPVELRINASVKTENHLEFRSFNLNNGEPVSIVKGQKTSFSLEGSLLQYNHDFVENLFEPIETSIEEMEGKGFYATVERQEFAKFKNLVYEAGREPNIYSYDERYADLVEANIGISQIRLKLNDIRVNASSSTFIITLFLTLTAVALSSFLVQNTYLKIVATGISSSLFFTIVYFTYPGFRLVQSSWFFIVIILSILITLLATSFVSRLSGGKIFSVFSIAKKNLKRRRLRFTLTLITVTVLAISFVTLTSFSTVYGLTTSSSSKKTDSEGLLIKNPLASDTPTTVTFISMDNSTIAWLINKQQIQEVAPKLENTPLSSSIGTLNSISDETKKTSIFGILGIKPTIESEITHLNELILEGEYLDDQKDDEVLISTNLALKLDVEIGDELIFNRGINNFEMEVVGLLDDYSLNRKKDVDGNLILPQKLFITDDDPPTLEVEPCNTDEIIILNYPTAQKLGGVSISRINAQIVDSDQALSLSRQIALERDLWVWASFNGQINVVGLGEYIEAKGLPVLIPWIIVAMNVVITMLNSIYERRKEIAIFSSIGLNPTHIVGIFLAESAVIGFIGGGMGYLFGLGGYRAMSILSITVEVRQKISAFWSLASLGVSVAAVLVGTIVAIQNSVVITPSSSRRWSMEKREDTSGAWVFRMPTRVREEEVDSLLNYLKTEIKDHLKKVYTQYSETIERRTIESEEKTDETHIKTIYFKYVFGMDDPVGMFPYSLIAEKKKDETDYNLKVEIKSAPPETIRRLVTFIRMLIVDWSSSQK